MKNYMSTIIRIFVTHSRDRNQKKSGHIDSYYLTTNIVWKASITGKKHFSYYSNQLVYLYKLTVDTFEYFHFRLVALSVV